MDIRKELGEIMARSFTTGLQSGVITKEQYVQYMSVINELDQYTDEEIEWVINEYMEGRKSEQG